MSPSTPHSPPAIFLQPTCHLHRFHRPSSSIHLSAIVERPERLRAIYLGLAAAHARLSLLSSAQSLASAQAISAPSSSDDLVRALEGLGISKPTHHADEGEEGAPRVVICDNPGEGARKVLRSKAVKMVHESELDGVVGQAGGQAEDRYLEKLVKWTDEVGKALKEGRSEIPDGLPQGDLYLCPESLLAISGALTTTIQAVDTVIRSSRPASGTTSFPFASDSTSLPSSTSQPLATPPLPAPASTVQASTAFCAIRPPGHHCGEDDPMGFCFVNNVLVGAAHAYLDHDIDRAIVLDIDLHHGNGTQDITLRLNSDTHNEELAVDGGKPAATNGKRGLKIFYGSVHDIYSFPCEDGNIDRIKDASISLASHGQYIENIHLSAYSSEQDFFARCYPRYLSLLTKAGEFLASTGGTAEKTMVFISAGFDASEHEDPGMQRHGGKVPTSFYARFHADTVKFAREHASGRVVSVLEGGYGDRALCSGALASLVGLSDGGEGSKLSKAEEEGWWSVAQLTKLEKATKPPPRRKGVAKPLGFPNPTTFAATAAADQDPWLSRTVKLLHTIETSPLFPQVAPSLPSSATSSPSVAGGGRTLRDRSAIPRTEKAGGGGGAEASVPQGSPRKKKIAAPLPTAPVPVKVAAAPTAKQEPVASVVSPPSPAALIPSPPAPSAPTLAAPSPSASPSASVPAPSTLPSFVPPPPSASTWTPSPLSQSTALPSTLLDAIALPTPAPSPAPPIQSLSEGTLSPSTEPVAPLNPKKIVLKFTRPAGTPLSPPAVEGSLAAVPAEVAEGPRDSVDE